MAFASNFGRILSPTFQPNSQAKKAGGWWLAGGIDPDDCIAAYQPKGAASYAASKVNLANPGTYDATDGTVYPSWNATDGWIYSGKALLFFTNIAVPKDQSWSFIGRYSNQGAGGYGGIFTNNATSGYLIVVNPRRVTVDLTRYCYGVSSENKNAYKTSGVIALAGRQPYLDGETDGTPLAAYSTTGTSVLTQGSLVNNADWAWNGYCQACAIYNTVLSAEQISALTDAMNDL